MLVGAGRIHRRSAAIEARPVPHIGHDQTGHDVLAHLGARLERTAVVEHPNVVAERRLDANGFGTDVDFSDGTVGRITTAGAAENSERNPRLFMPGTSVFL